MNNEFYHTFLPGFNWWYIVAPLMVLLMSAFGASNRRLNEKSLRIMGRDKRGYLLNALALILDFFLYLLVVRESAVGIVQLFANHLSPDDNPAWAIILFVFAVSVSAVFVYELLVYAGKLGTHLKIVYLKKKRRKIREERENLGQ